jgi:hypothetical protein
MITVVFTCFIPGDDEEDVAENDDLLNSSDLVPKVRKLVNPS